jgi:hypothetical protein
MRRISGVRVTSGKKPLSQNAGEAGWVTDWSSIYCEQTMVWRRERSVIHLQGIVRVEIRN